MEDQLDSAFERVTNGEIIMDLFIIGPSCVTKRRKEMQNISTKRLELESQKLLHE